MHFRNPPINEVVIATYFNPPLLDLRGEHIGLFWHQIKNDFPVVRQRPPVPMEEPIADSEVFPMPRYWFIAADDASLLQAQKSAFMFNWRRREETYPRFRFIKPLFDTYYNRFAHFIRTNVKSEEPLIDLCELTYVNAIQQCEFWEGPRDTTRVIPSFSLVAPGIDDSDATGFNCNFAYHTANDVQVHVAVRSGMTAEPPIAPILLLEIKATTQLGKAGKPIADTWFERAHDVVVECFLSMTSRDIQNDYWKRVDGI